MAATGKIVVTDARKYRIGELISKGAFSNVYECRDLSSKITYAIKVIDIQEVRERRMEHALMSEVRVMRLARVSPYVVSLVDSFMSEHNYYIIMNLAEGGTLLDLIREHKHVSFMETWAPYFMKQLLLGIDALHKHNIVHRDIKPENILLDKSRAHLVISDLGFACECAPNEVLRRTCGTLRYCAPELLREPASYVGSQVDVWAMGVTMYVMLFHTHPYKPAHNDPDAYLASIHDAPLTFPHTVSSQARDMLLKMLDTNASTRWTVGQLLQHPWLSQVALTAIDDLPLSPLAEPRQRAGNVRAMRGNNGNHRNYTSKKTNARTSSPSANGDAARGAEHSGTATDDRRDNSRLNQEAGRLSSSDSNSDAARSSDDDNATNFVRHDESGGILTKKSRSVIYSDMTENVDDGFYAVAEDSEGDMREDEGNGSETDFSPREGDDTHEPRPMMMHHGCSYRAGGEDGEACAHSYRGSPRSNHVSSAGSDDSARDNGDRLDERVDRNYASVRCGEVGCAPTSMANLGQNTPGTDGGDGNNNAHNRNGSMNDDDNDDDSSRSDRFSAHNIARSSTLSAKNQLYGAPASSEGSGIQESSPAMTRSRRGFHGMNRQQHRWRGPMEKLRSRQLLGANSLGQVVPLFVQTWLDWTAYMFHLWFVAFYFVFFCIAICVSSGLHRFFGVDITVLRLPFGLQRLANLVLLPLNEAASGTANRPQTTQTQNRQVSAVSGRGAGEETAQDTKKKK